MEFYYTKSSPYANCVRMVISEIGIEAQINFIEAHPFEDKESFLAASPLGKVPCLVADGETIADSEVICDYLDATHTGGELFNPIYADWRLKTFYSICSGLIDVSVARRIEFLRDKDGIKSEFWWQRYNNAISRTLKDIETRLAILPDEFTVLHINLLSALAYLDFRHSDINWREGYPTIEKFYQQFSSRKCFTSNQLTE
ncbi:glutathione S-transferase family protein [Aliikangiella coralliicola]|uniref:Glutathione S-transferase n=1 Tax=Aliikangiella coralliicola TaxID=2592383 RepID=A0A545UIF2_9GAMM|nr:glutathione S-transferase family protein [Aliikangiella coralliicola]TQV89213.1 glutathione S-transferase [Aliikangiella coralliicola]